jgi:hypothetical protein
VSEVREELHRILQSSGMCDGKTWGLQVTNASEHTLELRALMSAPGSSAAWDLRFYVRETLIAFLQQNYPQSLPRIRGKITRSNPAANRSNTAGGEGSKHLASESVRPAA